MSKAAAAIDRTISPLDRPRLSRLLEEAGRACFPDSERIGGSPQRNFYFRELLQRVIENTRTLGLSVTGGTPEELHAFTISVEREWRRQPDYIPGRSPYQLKAIKGLLSHWKSSVASQGRTFTHRLGKVRFYYRPGTANYPDTVLGAEIDGFVTYDAQRVDIGEFRQLPESARLPAVKVDTSDDVKYKETLIDRHVRRVFGRDWAGDYREKLQRLSLAEVKEHISTYDRHLSVGQRTLARAAVLAILIGWMSHSVVSQPQLTLKFSVTDHQPSLSNILRNESGQIAEFDENGIQISPWAETLQGSTPDNYVASVPLGGGRFGTSWQGPVQIEMDVPPNWRTPSETPLPAEVHWAATPCNCRTIIVWALIDQRNLLPPQSGGETPFTLQSTRTDTSSVTNDAEIWPKGMHPLDSTGMRTLVTWEYTFPEPCDYAVSVLYTPNFTKDLTKSSSLLRTQFARFPVAHFRVPVAGEIRDVTQYVDDERHFFWYCPPPNGSVRPQVAIARDVSGKPQGVIVIPDVNTWPPYAELANTVYAIGIRHSDGGVISWHSTDVDVTNTRDGFHYFSLDLPLSLGDVQMQLIGSYRGVPLPSSPWISLHVAPSDITFAKQTVGVQITRCHTALWNEPGTVVASAHRPRSGHHTTDAGATAVR